MQKIETLTKEQESMLAVYRDKWMKIGLSTTKADRPKAEDAIRRAYKIGGHKPPRQILWVTSPLAGAVVASILKNDELMKKIYADLQKDLKQKAQPLVPGASVGASVRASVLDSVGDSVLDSVGASVRASVGDSVGDSVWDSVGASVRDSVRASVGASVRASVGASVRASVRASVGDSVGDSVWASVRASVLDSVWDSVGASVWDSVGASVRDSVRASVLDSVWDSVRASVRASVWDSVYGQHEASWLGFYNYFLEQLKLEPCKKLIPLMDLAENANWWIPYKNIAIVSEKHHTCKLTSGRIHCVDGPAVQYSDGFSVWALWGVRVPQEIAETPAGKLDTNTVMKLPNAEQRLVAIRKIGPERVLKDLKAKVIDQKQFTEMSGRRLKNLFPNLRLEYEYELFEVTLEGSKEKLLKMRNPSEDKFHYEFVVPEVRTVNEALAWRRGIENFQEPVFGT
jgi:hypothetical protein